MPDRGCPACDAVCVLFGGHTGVPLATLDGDVITSRRTAAASALGVALLAKPDAHRLLVVGAGRVARLLAPAIASVRELSLVEVWNPPTPERAIVIGLTPSYDGRHRCAHPGNSRPPSG